MNTNSSVKKPSFNPVEIFDWTKTDTMKIYAMDYRERNEVGAQTLVTLVARSGAFSFQHSLTPEQARGMAAALMAAADFFEGEA